MVLFRFIVRTCASDMTFLVVRFFSFAIALCRFSSSSFSISSASRTLRLNPAMPASSAADMRRKPAFSQLFFCRNVLTLPSPPIASKPALFALSSPLSSPLSSLSLPLLLETRLMMEVEFSAAGRSLLGS